MAMTSSAGRCWVRSEVVSQRIGGAVLFMGGIMLVEGGPMLFIGGRMLVLGGILVRGEISELSERGPLLLEKIFVLFEKRLVFLMGGPVLPAG
jgi:hypothetical protein